MSGNARPVLVRFDPDLREFQAQCKQCAKEGRRSYWPLVEEMWVPRLGLQKCRACHNTARRLARRAKMDAKAKQRDYYKRNRAHRLEWVHSYRDKNRERINAVRRAAYARRVAAQRAAVGEQLGAFDE